MELEREVLRDLADIVAAGARREEELEGKVEDAGALMVYHAITLTARTIERLERCRVIVRCGVGVDNIDVDAAQRRGIPVANVPDYGTEEVADTAIGMLLALARGIAPLNSMLRATDVSWEYTHVAPLQRLRGQVLGIVGLGRIGTAVAQRGKVLGMDVVFYDPYKPEGYDKALAIRRARTLDDLLAQSYVVTLHCPLSDETRYMIDARAITKMRRGAFLINTARGAVVDTRAIPDAIRSGHLAGTGIDVLAEEPPTADDALILAWRDPSHPAHHRLLINPHAAFYCAQGLAEIRVKAATACQRALRGEPIPNVINLQSSMCV
jgi:D-3-phosphoglycerate dehydrogenase/C-terminal binding protein